MKPRAARRAWREDIRRRKAHNAATPQTRQAAPPDPAPSPVRTARRGLVRRYFGSLAQRRLVAALASPVAVPVIVVGVCVVLAAVALGAIAGALLLAGRDGGADW